MTIRELRVGDETKLEAFLTNHIETSMFLMGNARLSGFKYKPEPYHGFYLGSFEDSGKMDGVLAQFWNGNIMMQAPNKEVLSRLVHEFQKVAPRSIQGFLGETLQARTVMKELCLENADYAVNNEEDLYVLDLNGPAFSHFAVPHDYTLLNAMKVDRQVLSEWFTAYEIEALGGKNNEALKERINDRVERTLIGTDCWALIVDGMPVALSGFNSRLPDIVQIGPVWTPPEHRNNGYARNLVALTLQKAKKEGVEKSVLFTDNPYATKAYEAIGFRRCGSYCLAMLNAPAKIHL